MATADDRPTTNTTADTTVGGDEKPPMKDETAVESTTGAPSTRPHSSDHPGRTLNEPAPASDKVKEEAKERNGEVLSSASDANEEDDFEYPKACA